MPIMIRMRLSQWIRMQQKCYGTNLWFIKTPSGRAGMCRKPFMINHLEYYCWNPELEDHDPREYEAFSDTTYTVPKDIAAKLPIEPGTQCSAKELIDRVRKLEETE